VKRSKTYYFYRKGNKTNAYYFTVGKRHCRKCKEIKSLSEFWKEKSRSQGYSPTCKNCSKARQRSEWKRFGMQPVRMYQRLQQLTLGSRSKKNYVQHKLLINKEEFIEWYNKQKKQCVYCGLNLEEFLKIKKYLNKFMQKTNRFGIDRKNNNLPYHEDNIVLCCAQCNSLKGYLFSYIEFKEIVKKHIKPKLIKYLSYERK